MAIVTGPLHSSEARGAVGGIIYNTCRGKSIVRTNRTPTLEYTDSQVATRAIMNGVIAAWAALSDDQRHDWTAFADTHLLPHWTGSDKRISGWNWYAKANFKLSQADLPMISSPPHPVTSYTLASMKLLPAADAVEFIWDPVYPFPDPGWFLQIWSTKPHAATVHPSPKMAKLLTSFSQDTGDVVVPFAATGIHTVYIVPLSLQGITMPPYRFTTEVG